MSHDISTREGLDAYRADRWHLSTMPDGWVVLIGSRADVSSVIESGQDVTLPNGDIVRTREHLVTGCQDQTCFPVGPHGHMQTVAWDDGEQAAAFIDMHDIMGRAPALMRRLIGSEIVEAQ